jgi:hypothetical protein
LFNRLSNANVHVGIIAIPYRNCVFLLFVEKFLYIFSPNFVNFTIEMFSGIAGNYAIRTFKCWFSLVTEKIAAKKLFTKKFSSSQIDDIHKILILYHLNLFASWDILFISKFKPSHCTHCNLNSGLSNELENFNEKILVYVFHLNTEELIFS